jgi:hypothetical protein
MKKKKTLMPLARKINQNLDYSPHLRADQSPNRNWFERASAMILIKPHVNSQTTPKLLQLHELVRQRYTHSIPPQHALAAILFNNNDDQTTESWEKKKRDPQRTSSSEG